MGNYITFRIPSSETSWNYALIDRSLQQSAQFSGLTSQVITNNTFYDNSGTTAHWYRMRFFDSGNSVYSDYTDPFQVDGEYYCTPREVASFMGLDNFTDSTNPTRYEVEEIISRICDRIDEETHDSWRKNRVTDEYYNVKVEDRYIGWSTYPYDYSSRISLYLKHRNIRSFTSGTHKIEYWDGSSWVDFVANYTEGRDKDYWIDYQRGIIWFVNRYPLRVRSNVRVTYDWGNSSIPGDIREAAILLTASDLYSKQDIGIIYPQSTLNFPTHREKKESLEEKAKKILRKHEVFLSPRMY